MTDMTTAGQTEMFASPPGTEHNTFTIIGRCERTVIPYYNQCASNPTIAPRSDWLDAQQG